MSGMGLEAYMLLFIMPRRFQVTFSGCVLKEVSHARTMMHLPSNNSTRSAWAVHQTDRQIPPSFRSQ